jgi:hypothetical protein
LHNALEPTATDYDTDESEGDRVVNVATNNNDDENAGAGTPRREQQTAQQNP